MSVTVPSQRAPRRRLPIVVALIVVAGAILAAIVSIAVGEGGRPVEISGAGETQRLFGGILQDEAELGQPEAPVTVTIFNDLQCTPCADYQLQVVPPLVEKYVRDGDARLVFRHFSIGERETNVAAYAAVAAGMQDRQWQYVHLFYLNIDELGSRLTEDFLRGVAGAVLELDTGEWVDQVDSPEAVAQAESDAELALALRLPAQPAAVVEGPGGQRRLVASPSLASIEAAIEKVR